MNYRSLNKKDKCNHVDATQLRISIESLLMSSDEEEEEEKKITVLTTNAKEINTPNDFDEIQPTQGHNYLGIPNLQRSFESLLQNSDEELEVTTDISTEKFPPNNNQKPVIISTAIKRTPAVNNCRNELMRLQEELLTSNDESIETQATSNDRNKFTKSQSTPKKSENKLITPQQVFDKSSDDASDENILSLSWVKSQLGAAYYNMTTSELFVMDDVIEDDFNYSTTKALYKQCQPLYVLMTNGTAAPFVSVISKLIVKDTVDDENKSTPSTASMINQMARTSLQLLPKNENTYEKCYQRVNCLKLNCEPENASNAERITFLNSLLNFKSRMMIHALGLLLRYLDANWNKLSLNATGQAEFVYVNYIMLNDLVMIEEDTYKALNIMQSRFHPSLFKFGTSSRDQGSCLFTFLNRCQSRPGMQHLWKLMRHPTRNINVLQDRYRAIEFFMSSDNRNIVESLKSYLKKILRLTPSIINKYSTIQTKAMDWSRFKTTIANVINIAEICAQCRSSAIIFERISGSITNEMHYIRYFIDHIIDLEMSKKHRKFIVRAGVDPELDELNHKRQLLPQLLTEMAKQDLDNLPANVETCRMIYVPDIQYCLAVTAWDGPPPSDDEEIPGLEFKFIINGLRYYKSAGARELDETLGDIQLKITRRQSQIMLRLVQYISKHIGPILNSIEYCAELDVLLSFAMVSGDYNYIKPHILKSHIIDIKSGRHPLKELIGNFVANDTLSSDETSLVKIFSGPNACGKTIYLKQVALIVFMAHIGCYVPAESATIGIVTHILTQMPLTESIAQNASSFLIDLRQVNNILYSSTPNCLIIMDEFGQGTAQIDALALLSSILRSFVERGRYCPHLFVATHMHRTINLMPETSILAAQTFEFMLDEDNTIIFLYRLIPGNVNCSYAHAAAKTAGLHDDDVNQAMQVFEYIKKGKLPPIKAEDDQHNVLRHIVELMSQTSNNDLNLDNLRQWVRQAQLRKR